jgi:hypothetical protein
VCRFRGLEVDILNPRLSQGIAKLLHARPFYRPGRKKKQLYFAVERRCVGKRPTANCLDVKRAAAEPAAVAAQAPQVGKLVEMFESRRARDVTVFPGNAELRPETAPSSRDAFNIDNSEQRGQGTD